MFKMLRKKKRTGEAGQALILVLVLLTLVILFVPALLGFISTGAATGRVYDKKTAELYAADTGVQDAEWQVKSNNIINFQKPDYTPVPDTNQKYNPYDFTTSWSYDLPQPINSQQVNVKIKNVWIPIDIAVPDESQASTIIDAGKLIVTGGISAASTYQIKISYSHETGEDLGVQTVGIWLPAGFTYLVGSSNLEQDVNANFYSVPVLSNYDGGQAVVWNFSSYPFAGDASHSPFPGVDPAADPMMSSITFQFTSPQPGQSPDAVSWITTNGVSDIPFSWDANTKILRIDSTAGATVAEVYIAKNDPRTLSSTISGDYFAIGNSLIGGNGHPPDNYHYQLHNSSETSIVTSSDPSIGIPDDATIAKAYLYWTGWEDWNGYQPDPIFYDNCNNFTSPPVNWTAGSRWTFSSPYFKGQGGSSSDLTSDTIPLGAYAGQPITLSLGISESNAEAGDYLYYQFYNSSGWSTRETLFEGNDSSGTYSITIPDGYLTPVFRMRFTVDFTTTDEYVSLDNITIAPAGLKYPSDPSAENIAGLVENTARVNEVLFNDTPVTTKTYQVLSPSAFTGTVFEGTWFYTAMADVTDYLNQWIADGKIESNGAGDYTFGNYFVGTNPSADNYRVNAADPSWSFPFIDGGSTGYPLGTPSPSSYPSNSRYTAAHAGWSLVIIYTSPETLGHQLYLYDIKNPKFNFFYGWHNNVDFDNDGIDGGTISGFLVPAKIPGETLAGRITVFVGEGDAGYTGDQFIVNGVAMSNSRSPSNNVWNSDSPGLTVPGVDIDSFDITWGSNILMPGDTSVKIDIPTDTDGFTMTYMILSFRSQIVTGGDLSYLIR